MNNHHEHEFCRLSDEEVVALARENDAAALDHIMARYRNYVYKKASLYFVSGGDREDIIQEGMIGLYKAVRDFDSSVSDSFAAFAATCVKRQIISAVKASTRKKHIPLNSYISLSEKEDATDSAAPAASEASEPLSVVLDKEYKKRVSLKIYKLLSKFELRVLYCYLEGMSYSEIAEAVNRDTKAVDNAVYRIKKKLLVLLCHDED